ncbi:MAG: UDP-N-acetylmuramate dehydrogenase [Paraprevotella sp.]|nr:UDP-N-acetylmuramate dehydrogenase [Paraprevotella sp.]
MIEKDNYSLLSHNTFGIAASARHFITYDSVADLQAVVAHVRTDYADEPVLHIGGGSNLLFLSDFNGVVLHSAIKGIERINEGECGRLRVGAAVVWDDFVAYCVEHGFHGVENLSLIPGDVGASAVQNIGAYGAEVKDVIAEVETVDLHEGTVRVFPVSECGYGYRQSVFKSTLRGRYAVTHVLFKLSREFRPDLDYGGVREALRHSGIRPEAVTAEELRRTIIDIRKAKLPDPTRQGNAGSFFMNPVVEHGEYERLKADYSTMPHYDMGHGGVKIPAGWLIEQCGWKGRALGRAAVHDRQALVLVNRGGATGKDILDLCEAVRTDVLKKFGIAIQPEVNFIGTAS